MNTVKLSDIYKELVNDPQCYKTLHPILQNDERVVRKALELDGVNYIYIPKIYQENKDITLLAAKSIEHPLTYVPKQFREDKQVVEAILKNNGYAIIEAPTFKNDPYLASIAVQNKGSALKFFNDNIKDRIDIVKMAIAQDSEAIKYASGRVQSAIKQDEFDKNVKSRVNAFDMQKQAKAFFEDTNSKKDSALYNTNVSYSPKKSSTRSLNMMDDER